MRGPTSHRIPTRTGCRPHVPVIPAQAYVAQMLQTFVEFPQRQKSASFNLEQVMAKLQDGAAELS